MTGAVVVGTGFGCLTHVRCPRSAGFAVVALVGRDDAKTKERAARFDVANACTSPRHTHADLVRAPSPPGSTWCARSPASKELTVLDTLLASHVLVPETPRSPRGFRYQKGEGGWR